MSFSREGEPGGVEAWRSLTWLPVLGWFLGSSDGFPGFEMLMLLLEDTSVSAQHQCETEKEKKSV